MALTRFCPYAKSKGGKRSAFYYCILLVRVIVGGKAGYGITSQFDTKTGTFIHEDMLVD